MKIWLIALLCCVCLLPLSLHAQINNGGGSGLPAGPTSPNGLAQVLCSTPSGGVAGAATYCRSGVSVNTQTLASAYTVAVSDLGNIIKATNAGSGTINVPDGGTAPFTSPSNFAVYSAGAGTITLTRTSTSQFCFGNQACTNTYPVTAGQVVYLYLDAANNWIVSYLPSGGAVTVAPTDTANTSLKVSCPPSMSVDCASISWNGGTKAFFIDNGGQVNMDLTTGTLCARTNTGPNVLYLNGCTLLIVENNIAGSGSALAIGEQSDDHLAHYNANNAGIQQFPMTSFITSVYTNATTTFSSVTFSPALPTLAASRNYTVTCQIDWQGSASTTGPKFQFTGPASPTNTVFTLSAGITATSSASAGAHGTAFSLPVADTGTITATTDFHALVTAGIINGANSGAIALQAAANGAGTLTIEPGSFCVTQ